MSIIGELLLGNLLAYLINLASNERSSAIGAARERKLKEALEQEEALKKALASTRSIRDEVRLACIELARNRSLLGVTQKEEPVWRLLADEVFQTDLAEWLMAGAIEEGNAAKERLLRAMELALSDAGANAEQIAFLRSGYFEAVEKAVFANPILARWRDQLCVDYLRKLLEEAAGKYSLEKQEAALASYCEKVLVPWDIVDLANLPRPDVALATQRLLMRQMYVPLRLVVLSGGENDDAFERLEQARELRRLFQAGRPTEIEAGETIFATQRHSVGERLTASRRLVVLGDPGGGKTTMLRWMATAYLLHHRGDAAFSQLPDTQTLPAQPWIPVLIRCRELGEADLCRCFVDFLTQHLNKTKLLPDEAEVMRALILDRIAKGEALLLVDGLDEIANPRVRMTFCKELERTAERYKDAPIVVTSRIVGYRDMPYRMKTGFEHVVIANLSPEDKDLFAERWAETVHQHQPPEEKQRIALALRRDIHSSEGIERLTINPVLLTTLALVRDKVQKLPSRRHVLYKEAAWVLLNWNYEHHERIEDEEGNPQLEYLAYEMCRRGIISMPENDVLLSLEHFRREYPNVRAAKQRTPEAFLNLLEARSGIVVKSGGGVSVRRSARVATWEFCHLTFQEFFAAQALLEGHYHRPHKEKWKKGRLAKQVALLSSPMEKRVGNDVDAGSFEIPQAWQEVLRLVVLGTSDDEVDAVMRAILNPLPKENALQSARPRVVIANSCIHEESNASDETLRLVKTRFAELAM